ncbi:MAG: hypothetical protein WCQ20_13045 [Synechococcaceae cyanobacterium ELA739]|jgi:hypothetical protein
MDPVLAELLAKLEAGQIHRHEMAAYQNQSQSAAIRLELMWILFAIDTLEEHRLRLVDKLRALQP